MVIAGAGGHGREVVYALIQKGLSLDNIIFFDENNTLKNVNILGNKFEVISDVNELRKRFSKCNDFYLGVGNPKFRQKFNELLSTYGGCLRFIQLSNQHDIFMPNQERCDLMPNTFLGPDVTLGTGVLINTGAQVHHDSCIGNYSEIGPKAMLLGKAKVGKRCRIGAGAIILPGVTLGDDMVVGAGAVVTRDYVNSQVLVGIPARLRNN